MKLASEADAPMAAAEQDAKAQRQEHRILQAEAFNRIGDRYDEAFPHKEGQLDAGRWLLERLSPGARVLDVGCGTGLPTARQLVAAGCDVTGIDISPVMLDLARRNVPEARFLERDMTEIDSSLGQFDAIVCFFSLLMLPRAEIQTTLRRFREVLVPGGFLVLSMVEIDMDDVPFPFLGAPVRVTGYLRDDMCRVVEDAGFTVLRDTVIPYAPETTEAPPEIQHFICGQRKDA